MKNDIQRSQSLWAKIMKHYGKIFIVAGWILAVVLLQGCSQIQTVFQSKEMSAKNSVSQTDESLLEEAKRASDNGDKSRAEEIYREYIKKHPKGNANALGVAHARLGMLLSERKEYQESREYFEKAMSYKPDDLEICGAYANSLFEQEDYIGAESLWRQGLQIAPNDKRFQMMLGYTLMQEKKYQAGASYLKRAVGEQKAYEEMAAIYRSHEEYERAIVALNKSQKIRSKEQQLNYAANQQVNGYQNPQGYMMASTAAVPNNMNNVPVNNRVNIPGNSPSSYNNQQYNNPSAYVNQQYPAQTPIQSYTPQASANGFSQNSQQYPYQSPPVSNPNLPGVQRNDGFTSIIPSSTALPPVSPQARTATQIPPPMITQNGYYAYPQPPNYGNYDTTTVPNAAAPQPIPNRPIERQPTELQSPGVQPTGMPYGFASSQPTVNPSQPLPNRTANAPHYYAPQEIAQRPHYNMPPIQNYPTPNPPAPYYTATAQTESSPQPVNPLARTSYGYDASSANTETGNAVSNARMFQTFNP
jgi:tetratricopeptide (TPR) repeat protein